MTRSYDDVDDVVLYDIFRESATRLGGWLVSESRRAKKAGDPDLAAAWWAEHLAVWREKNEIDATDRRAQIEAMQRYTARREAIDSGAGPLPAA